MQKSDEWVELVMLQALECADCFSNEIFEDQKSKEKTEKALEKLRKMLKEREQEHELLLLENMLLVGEKNR